MLMLQNTPLPPDVEYVLDAALEHDELDAASHYALRLYGARSTICNIVDTTTGVSMSARIDICERLTDYADDVLRLMEPRMRAATLSAGMTHLRHRTEALAPIMANWAIEDMVVGGCLKPYIRGTKWSKSATPSPKMRRRLYGRNWVRRFVGLNFVPGTVDPVTLRGPHLVARCRGIDLASADETAALIEADIRAQHEAYRLTNDRMARRFLAAARGVGAERERKSERRRRRRVICRAALCAETVIGREAVAEFARGKPVLLPGTAVSLEVSRVLSCATMGHGALHVVAVDPVSRRRLADMCVYHQKTPALDQLTALALAMSAGEEVEIVETSNLSMVSDTGLANPVIRARYDRDRRDIERAPAPDGWIEPLVHGRPYVDPVKAMNEAYWRDTSAMWTETVGIKVMGRMWAA